MIRIAFSGFWPNFDKKRNFITDALNIAGMSYVVTNSPLMADVIFHSHFKTMYEKFAFKKLQKRKINIFFSGEATEFDPGEYDASISSRRYMSDVHFRLPLWKIYINYDADLPGALTEYDIPKWHLENTILSIKKERKFAAAVFSNMNSVRRYLLDGLSLRGSVDIYGRYGLSLKNKMTMLPNYWLNLCPENAIVPGYITEKIIHAKACGCIPVWFGDLNYQTDFNKDSLVNMLEFDMNFEAMMDCVDFSRIAETPLLEKAEDYRPDLAKFLLRFIS